MSRRTFHPQQSDIPRRICGRGIVVGLLLAGVLLLSGCSWVRQRINDRVAASNRLSEAAQAAKEQGKHERAGELLRQAARANPDDADVRIELAQWLVSEGRPADAIRQLRSIVTRNPDDIGARFELARLQFDHGDRGEADRSARAVLELDPEHTGALMLRAAIARQRKERDLARELYHRVLQGDPDNAAAKLQIAEVEMEAAHPDRAAPLLRSVCESSRSTPGEKSQACWSLGLAYGREARWNEAATTLAAAATTHPSLNAADWYRVAYAQYQSGRIGEARDSLNHVLRIDPRFPAARAMAARIASGNRTAEPIVPANYVSTAASPPAGPSRSQ